MISVDWENQVVQTDESILDIVEFKDTLRLLEASVTGLLYPNIIDYKRLDLGGGAFFHAVDFVNGYRLQFTAAGNYSIIGNVGATILPTAGVYVERKTSAAFASVSDSSSPSSPAGAIIMPLVTEIVQSPFLSTEVGGDPKDLAIPQYADTVVIFAVFQVNAETGVRTPYVLGPSETYRFLSVVESTRSKIETGTGPITIVGVDGNQIQVEFSSAFAGSARQGTYELRRVTNGKQLLSHGRFIVRPFAFDV